MKRTMLILLGITALVSCYQGSSDNLRDPVSSTGVSATIQANLPLDSTQAQVAGSVFKDGKKQALVGGDVFKAYSESSSIIMRSIENLSGDYLAELTTINPGAGIEFVVTHDPEGAREDRWYPVDELLVDPGPGELVGNSVIVDFPDAIILANPGQGNVYSDRSDDIILNWGASPSTTDQIRVTTVQECHSATRSITWANTIIPDFTGAGTTDTGTHTISVGSLVPDTGILNSVVGIVDQLSVIIVGSILEAYTYGLINAESISLDTFAVQYCDITITVFRELKGQLNSGISGGYAIGSTSDTVSVVFQP